MKATIVLNEGPDRFWKYDPTTRGSYMVEAYQVEVEDAGTIEATLERIFRAANRVDGSDIEQVPDGFRSLSTGDIVWLMALDDEGNLVGIDEAYEVAMMGFRHLEGGLRAFSRHMTLMDGHVRIPQD